MSNYKVKFWDDTGKAVFSIKEADPKKLRKKFDKIMNEKMI
jgi:hypothetical protein